MFRAGGVVEPKNSPLLDATVHEYWVQANDASKSSPTICLNFIRHLQLRRGNSHEAAGETLAKLRRDEWKLPRSGSFYQDNRFVRRVPLRSAATKRHMRTQIDPFRFCLCSLCAFLWQHSKEAP